MKASIVIKAAIAAFFKLFKKEKVEQQTKIILPDPDTLFGNKGNIRCAHCIGCSNSRDCKQCYNCEGCLVCVRCAWCYDCILSNDCIYCHEIESGRNCIFGLSFDNRTFSISRREIEKKFGRMLKDPFEFTAADVDWFCKKFDWFSKELFQKFLEKVRI